VRIAFIDYTTGGRTSTFLLRELIELQRLGLDFEVFRHKRPEGDSADESLSRLERPVHDLRPVRILPLLRRLAVTTSRHPLRTASCLLLALLGSVLSVKDRARTLLHLGAALSWAPLLERGRFDRVHALWASGPGSTGLFLSRLTGLPFSFSCHATDIFVERLLLPEKLRHADVVVTCTRFNRGYLEERFPVDVTHRLVRVSHHGLPLDRLVPRPRTGSSGTKVVLAIGQLDPKKGFPLLVEALALVRDAGLSFRCRIIGEGRDRPAIEETARRHGLTSAIELPGAMPFSRVIDEFRRATLFVMPSLTTPKEDRDGIPNVVLEAMAMGIPVVATSVSGIPEVVEDGRTGLLVPEKRKDLLADAVQRLLTDDSLGPALAARARERVERDFDQARNGAHLLEILREAHGARNERRESFALVSPNLDRLFTATEERPFAGGAEVQQSLLARELAGRGHRVVCVVRKVDGGEAGPTRKEGLSLLPYDTASSLPRPLAAPLRAWRLVRALRRADATVYCTRGAKTEAAVTWLFCRLRGRVHVHATAHDTDCTPGAQHELRSRMARLLYRRALCGAHAVIAQTEEQRELLSRGYRVEATTLPSLMPGVPGAADRHSEAVLWVGAIKPAKRPRLFLALARDLPDERFRLVGFDKREDPELHAFFTLVMEEARTIPNLETAGFVPFLDTDREFARASLLITTSESEGYPNTHLQAFRHGVPVVATCDPGGAIERHGMGRLATSEGELARHVRELLSDRATLEDMGRRARAYVARHHDPAPITNGFLAVVEEIGAKSRGLAGVKNGARHRS
jgi:glycosyltransferase involved in cell wall biosynthesis